MANNISKRVGSSIRADEISWEGLKKNPKSDADAALLDLGLGGGVSKPIPVFSGETVSWTIYPVTSTEDDDKPGIYCLTVWDMPHDSMALKVKYCYVKADGTYGRVRWFESYRLDDDERAAGRVEVQFGPLRPNSRIDIVRAVAVKRAAKDIGNPGLDEEDRRGKGTTPAYTPEAIPSDTGIGAYWGDYDGAADDQAFANRIRFTSGPNTMATILTKNYIVSSPRILDVGTPKKEVDGVYFPVTFGVTNGAELLTSSIRMGIYRVGTKAGGATAYSKRIPVPRYELTDEDRDTLNTASQLTIDVGPVKANKRYHIRWARARYSLDPDDSGAKTIRVRYPVEAFAVGTTPPDVSLNYISTATVDGAGSQWSRNIVDTLIAIPGNDTGTSPNPSPNTTSGPQLAVLDPTGDITDPPSDPNASDIITNEPDDATEKDKDAIIILRIWAAEGNRAKYLIDPADPTMVTFQEANVNRVAAVIKTYLKDGTTYKQRRHGEDVEDPDAVFWDIMFHRRINKDLVWVKNVSLNEADREFSSTVDLAFVAGDTGSASDIASVTLNITQDGDDNRQAEAEVIIANGTVSHNPAVPKRLVILRTKFDSDNSSPPATLTEINNGNTKWKPVFKKNLRADSDVLADEGTHTLTYTIPGVTASKGLRYYRAYVFVVGDTAWAVDEDDNTGGADDVGITDAVAPPAPAAAPTMRHRHGHMRSKVARASVAVDGNKTIYQYEWQFGSHASTWTTGGAPARTFLQDDDTTPITTTSSTITSTGTKLSIPIKKKDFATWQSGITNIYCRVRAHNQSTADTYGYGAGIGEWSPVLTFAIGSAGASLDDSQAMDTVAPGVCGAVRIKFRHGNLRCKTLAPSLPTTDGNQNILSYTWVISNQSTYNNASSYYLTEGGTDPEITVAGLGTPTLTFVTGGPTISLPIRKHLLQSFATVYCHVVATNNIGTGSTYATGSVAYSSLVSGVYNDDEEIPLRRTFHGRRNLWEGGDNQHSTVTWNTDPDNLTTAITQLGRNVRLTPGGTRVTTTSTASNIIWNQALHCVEVGPPSNGAPITSAAVTFVGRIKKSMSVGETYALSLEARMANTTLISGTSMSAVLVDASGTTISNTCTWTMGGISATTFQTYAGMVFTVSTNTTGAVWLRITTFSAAENNHLLLDRFCLVRGSQSQLWEPTDKEVNNEPAAGVVTTSNGLAATELGVGFGNDGYDANGGRFTA